MKFKVTLGHETVTIEAETKEEAIAKARILLSERWPRLYDVIFSKPVDSFEIEERNNDKP